jgi:tyrosine-protein phosphatase SIW14
LITQVDEHLWRGPRPEPYDYARIKTQFPVVISLEGAKEDYEESLELAPVKLLSMSIGFTQIYFTGISQSYLNNILWAIKNAPAPVLVHCQHGEDRTGLIVAAYRVMVSGWDKNKAMAEALHFGYRDWLNFGLNETWSQFA